MWTAPSRTPEAAPLYLKAEADRKVRPERYDLSPAHILSRLPEDVRAALDADNGDWREGFEVYLKSAAEEGHLNALGLMNVGATAIGRLRERVSIAKALKAKPDRAGVKIDRPIFVIGGWRTGTTLLQRLLDSVSTLRGLYPSELTAPSRFGGLDAAARKSLIEASSSAHQMLHVLSPTLKQVHPSGAFLAEECVLAMGTDFRNWGFTSTLRSPSYAAWLLSQDISGSYRRYADILRLLQDDSGRRWSLKAPAHTASLQALFAAFPDAHVIHLHRDVVETVTSGATLFSVFRSIYSDNVDPVDVGRYQLDMTEAWFTRAMRDRDNAPSSAKIIDIAFTDLVADPIATLRSICRACDVEWDGEVEEAATLRLTDLNADKGTYRCAPADFRLDPDEIRARLASYSNRFLS